jgi:tetratricopeptide (TPR) repeat protein
VELYRKTGEAGLSELVIALANEAQILLNMSKPDRARRLLDEGEALGRRLGQSGGWSLAMLLWVKGSFVYTQGDFESAQSISKESWALFLQIGDRWNAGPLMVLGLIAQGQKRYDLSQRYYEDALAAYSEINDRGGIVFALNNLTFLSIVLGDLPRAAGYYHEQLRIWQAQGNLAQIIGYIKIGCYFSTMELLKLAPEEAVDKFRTVLSVLELSVSLQPEGSPSLDEEALIHWYLENAKAWAEYNAQPFSEDDRASIRANFESILSALGEKGFREALVQGKTLDLEQAISRILDFPL